MQSYQHKHGSLFESSYDSLWKYSKVFGLPIDVSIELGPTVQFGYAAAVHSFLFLSSF